MARVPVLALVLGVTGWQWVQAVSAPSAEVRPDRERVVRRFPSTSSAHPTPASPLLALHEQALKPITEDCGLPVQSLCDSGGCVAVLEVPDLDRAAGWAAMTTRHPAFVLNILGREAGWDSTPCSQAVTRSFEQGVRTFEQPGRDEVWCAETSADGEPLHQLCDRAASILGRTTHFSTTNRRLRF